MLKFMTLRNCKAGMTHEGFCRYWRETHGPLAVRIMPGIKRYMQNHAVFFPGQEDPPFDGAAVVWFDGTREDLYAWYSSDAGRQLRDDEQEFIDTSRVLKIGECRGVKPLCRGSGRVPQIQFSSPGEGRRGGTHRFSAPC